MYSNCTSVQRPLRVDSSFLLIFVSCYNSFIFLMPKRKHHELTVHFCVIVIILALHVCTRTTILQATHYISANNNILLYFNILI